MNKTMCGIYIIKNKVNNKVYIGQSVNIDKRWYDHINALNNHSHYNYHLQAAWDKYGKDAFVFDVIELCSKECLDLLEMYYILEHKSNDPENGYNLTSGGEGTRDISEELKKKRKESFMRYIESNPDFIENHRRKTLEQFKNEEFYSKYINLRRSDEFREKERASHVGQQVSEERKQQVREQFSKPVLCVETGVVYKSAKEAAKSLPGNKNIQAAASGIRKTAGGYHWKYIDAV